jgi:hypothetical protein
MVELLAEAKRQLLAVQGSVTVEDFEAAWDVAWAQMVTERAWPHNTVQRRQWRNAMKTAMKPEARACFVNQPTAFQFYVGAIFGMVDESRDARTPGMTGVRRSGTGMRGVSVTDGRERAVA